jgi:LPS-assembly lipoprotein
MIPTPIRFSLLLAITLLLAGCGFQLRGTGPQGTVVPDEWKSMHLATGNPNSEFSREITVRFAVNGVEWMERQDANYVLQVQPEQFRQRSLSLNSEARTAEFELTMSSRFSVFDASGNPVMEEVEVSVIKQMENDPRNVVGKAGEVQLLKGEMRTELAQQIMLRIGYFAASTRPDSPQ